MTDWYPSATVFAGPSQKAYAGTNPALGVVCHSAVGYKAGLHQELTKTTTRKAWHFSVFQDGTVEQHYPLTAVLAHSADWGGDADGANGNGALIGIEHEGGFNPANEPLTPAQKEASVKLVQWIAAQRGWVPSRAAPKTLWEHNEISDTGTACPSARIPWAAYVQQIPLPTPTPPLSRPLTVLDVAQLYTHFVQPAMAPGVRTKPLPPTATRRRYELELPL